MPRKREYFFVLFALLLAVTQALATIKSCDVVIVGGSTSAIAAAIASARAGAHTCLLEPTDWPGGQITAGGVPAIDFAWHVVTDPKANFTLNVNAIDHDPHNITPLFNELLNIVGNTGKCWVSTYCFLPEEFLAKALFPAIEATGENLQIFYNTVVKSVDMSEDGTQILSVTAIQRTVQRGVPCGGWDQFLSEQLEDWYSPENSSRFTKEVIEFESGVFIDASEWGELLALSGAPYLQGMSEQFDGDSSGIGNDTCGMGATFGFVEQYTAAESNESTTDPFPPAPDTQGYYNLNGATWQRIWTYRRLFAARSDGNISAGDISLQNWDHGNDNLFNYVFLSREEAAEQRSNWQGGVSIDNLRFSEELALGYHYWYKNQTNIQKNLSLSNVFGTCHGLSKMIYMRDSRRSVGIGNFVMNVTMIDGVATQMVGEIPFDRVAIGSYDVDVRYIYNCTYPAYVKYGKYSIMPYYIPLRALTNAKIQNLIVTGKCIAQSFLTNAATRLHPIEWSSGTAGGVAAAFMAAGKMNSTSDLFTGTTLSTLQVKIAAFTPINWYINGTYYPPK